MNSLFNHGRQGTLGPHAHTPKRRAQTTVVRGRTHFGRSPKQRLCRKAVVRGKHFLIRPLKGTLPVPTGRELKHPPRQSSTAQQPDAPAKRTLNLIGTRALRAAGDPVAQVRATAHLPGRKGLQLLNVRFHLPLASRRENPNTPLLEVLQRAPQPDKFHLTLTFGQKPEKMCQA